MSVNTILRDEVVDILAALRFSTDAALASAASPEEISFQQGYHVALEAVARALGFSLLSSPTESGRARSQPDDWQFPISAGHHGRR